MSLNSNDNNTRENQQSLVTYRRNAHFGSTVQYTSSVVINLRQLQTNLQAQHQHEKEALTELNQRLHLFVGRVQSLESQNSKYLSDLAAYRRQSSGDSGIDIQWNERYLSSKSDLLTLRNAKLDGESDFEWSQLQVGIYQQLFDTEQQWRDKRLAKLQQELKQSASELVTLRSSYGDLERTTVNQYAQRDDIFKQYLSLTYDWCTMKKQRKKWDLSVEILKSYIAFYKSVRSSSTRSFESSSIQSDNDAQYWAVELDRSVKRIRQDFETFYATISREITLYYDTKMEEAGREVEQMVHYQRLEMEELVVSQQTLQVEYEKVQYSLTYERETFAKLESTYSKLEKDFNSIEGQYDHQFESQSQEAQSLQESLMTMAYDINEIQRSKVHLETEIIIYRYLLDTYGTGERVTVVPHKQIVESGMTGKFIAKGRKKRSVGIKECAANGKYISMVNYSTSKDIDISRWTLKQRVDSSQEIRYTIPDGVRLPQGRELRIYAKLSSGNTNETSVQQLVNNNIVSWGVGDTIETFLYNHNGEEEASFLQSIELRKRDM